MNEYTLDELEGALQSAGLKYKRSGRYIVSQCVSHEDRNPSMQLFVDGWCNCLSGCGRFHITKFFPSLRRDGRTDYQPQPIQSVKREEKVRKYTKYELFESWQKMPKIPRDHVFKGIPLETLDDLGWRWTDGIMGMGAGYFIPYFNSTRTSIPFAQVRHLEGNRRFTFLPDAQMTIYGKWNLIDNPTLFIVEGTSDGATLEYCMVPWVAFPSASSAQLIKEFARYCVRQRIKVVYAGDNDTAGNALLAALDETAGYRLHQPPKKYKDWGDFFQAEGQMAVFNYCKAELFLTEEYHVEELAETITG